MKRPVFFRLFCHLIKHGSKSRGTVNPCFIIEYDAIMQDKKLSELLGIPELSDEEKELALKMKGILDRIDDETRIDRTTAFRAVLDKMTKEPEENWSLPHQSFHFLHSA